MSTKQQSKTTTPAQASVDFADAINRADLGAAREMFAEDACFLTADGRAIQGRAAISEILEQLIASGASMSVEVGRVLETTTAAIASERWTMQLRGADGTAAEQSGESTVVFAATPQGWRILIDAPWGL
jgi:uncharacterized protein (TIGR02246 family)